MTGSSAPASSLGHVPDGAWKFDEGVAACFDDMLARSIPQLDVMRAACLDVGRRFLGQVPDRGALDLGASRGNALAPFVEAFPGRRHVAVETSPPMLAALRERFGADAVVVDHDLRRGFPNECAALVLSVLALQFTPMEHRLRILRDAYRATSRGGALILVEKVLGASADLDELMVDAYLRRKATMGYSAEEIERKRLSLEGVLVPVTAKWNEELLRGAGFAEVDCFWRWMNFAAWVAVKP